MCGRYSLVCIDDLGNRFRVFNPMIGARSRFNVAPGNEMPVIVRAHRNELALMRWGLVPHGTHDIHAARPLINARAETLAKKPSFESLLKNRRCLVPASGFFEWKKEGTRKIPFYVHLPENPCFSFAGLYDEWHDPSGTTLSTYTIVTTEPNALMATIHNRQPAILSPEHEEVWLAGDVPGPDQLKEILAPCPAEQMAMYPVSHLANTPAIDDERIIQPLTVLGSDVPGKV
ncbi:MAG: SOS response-associated peptidase [Methanoregula sp.]|jgi:putative SOS response-associated peptidase YedK